MMRRTGAALAAVAVLPAAAAAQPAPPARVYMRDVGPGVAGRLLREILAGPHTVVVAPDTGIVFTRGTDVPTTLVVIGGPARLEGRVRGDFVVLGDLVLRPGAQIDGRAIAYGGEIANSSLAVVRGGRLAFRDAGFRATQTAPGQLALDYEALSRETVPVLSLPGVFGVRIPTYDRVNGLSVSFGPEIALDTGRIRVEPTATYRSQLGVVDPGLAVLWQPGRRTTIEARAARATFTNDEWIRGDLVNSVTSLGAGSDARNYYRADRAELSVARQIETTSAIVTPFVGAAVERAWSAARDSSGSRPWSFLGRNDAREGIRRPNPRVTGGTISSALVGVRANVLRGAIKAGGALRVEVPVSTTGGERFVQVTGDGRVAFPTFRDQTFEALGHAVATTGDRPPSQRFAYLGGGSTIPTLPLLAQGGDQLMWLESGYTVPVTAIRLPFVGSPSVTLRHVVGGAGVDRLPALTQNVGLRITLAGLRLDAVVDPAHTDRHELGVSVGFR